MRAKNEAIVGLMQSEKTTAKERTARYVVRVSHDVFDCTIDVYSARPRDNLKFSRGPEHQLGFRALLDNARAKHWRGSDERESCGQEPRVEGAFEINDRANIGHGCRVIQLLHEPEASSIGVREKRKVRGSWERFPVECRLDDGQTY